MATKFFQGAICSGFGVKMDPIAKTSLLTAAMRAAETKRSDSEGRLFTDPYAALLAGSEGEGLLQRALTESGEQPAIAIRTYFIDQKINQALNAGVRQIVMLVAGMDTRAYRLDFPQGVRLFELDRQEVLNYKSEKLSGVGPRCQRLALSVDLAKDWSSILIQAGFKKGTSTLWLIEGLVMYLEVAEVLQLMESVHQLSSAGDILIFDILSRSLLEAPNMKNQLQFLKSIGAQWRFGVNEPEQFLKKWGWSAKAVQAGDVSPDRWPFPMAPRHVPNVPRGFFVQAVKIP